MAFIALLFMLMQSLIQYPQPVGDGLDEAMHQRMQEHEELMKREMARLLQELEQGPPEQQGEGWGALLFGALQQWPFWALAGVLLLLGLWFSCRRRSHAADSGNDQSSCKSLREEKGKEQEEDSVDSKEDKESNDETVKVDDPGVGSEGEGSTASANEGDDSDGNESNDDVKVKEGNDVKNEDGHDAKKDEGWSDGNVPGDNHTKGNRGKCGRFAGNEEGHVEPNEGKCRDVKVEQANGAGREEEEGDGNEGKMNDANMRAGKKEDVNKGQYNVDGKGENTGVKVQESSDASEYRSGDSTGQENNSDGEYVVDHSIFAATNAEKNEVQNEEGSDGKKDEKHRVANLKGDKTDDGNGEEHNNVASTEEDGDKANGGESNDVKVEEDSNASEQKGSGWNGKNEEHGDANGKGDKNEDGKEEEGGNVAAKEKEGNDGGKEDRVSGATKKEEDTRGIRNKRGILLVDHIQWPVEDLERGCSVTAELMESFTRVFVDSVCGSFYPVPQQAIGVGSAFEGWSPCERDVLYCVLVPLSPPPGHAFRLELNSAGQAAARTFCVCVEQVCTCRREQLGEKLLCFLHCSEEELRREQKPSLLETLCTSSYLDVEKTCHWFYQLVRSAWLRVPQSHSWHLVFQPSSRSCQFRLSQGKKSLTVEMLFRVHQGDSDVFVVSQPAEAQKGSSSIFVSSRPAQADFIPSTAWPETYAVAEAKFFRHIARQVPRERLHLKCLQVFTCILRGTGFSSSTWKTVLMHLLSTVPLSRWHRREFARRLWDMMGFLRRSLQSKRLEHFVLGNERLPAEISLPPAARTAEPLNLLEHLARDPAAHAEAMRAYGRLRFRLWMLLSSH